MSARGHRSGSSEEEGLLAFVIQEAGHVSKYAALVFQILQFGDLLSDPLIRLADMADQVARYCSTSRILSLQPMQLKQQSAPIYVARAGQWLTHNGE